VKLALTLHRMLPSASCQGVGVLKFGVFRGSITWPTVPPVYASYLTLRSCPQDSEPVWLAGPSPYGSFIRFISTAYAVRSTSCSSKLVGTALKRTRCLRTGCWRCDTTPPTGLLYGYRIGARVYNSQHPLRQRFRLSAFTPVNACLPAWTKTAPATATA